MEAENNVNECNGVVNKHVAAIHVGAKGLGLLGRKSMNATLLLAREDIQIRHGNVEEFLKKNRGIEVNHSCSVQDFKSLINYDSRDYKRLRSVLTSLSTTPVEFNIFGEKQEDDVWEVMSFLSHASLKNGVVTFRFASEIREQLLAPLKYAPISIDVQNKFRSEYSLALYENVYRYVKIGRTPWFFLAKLKSALGCETSKYNEFRYFSRVIKNAMSEINKVSDVMVEMKTKKEGRSVKAIQFYVARQREPDMIDRVVREADHPCIIDMLKLGLSHSQIQDFLSVYDIEYLEKKIAFVLRKVETSDDIENIAAFAYAAIADDYGHAVIKPHELKKQRKLEAMNSAIEIDENAKQLIDQFGNVGKGTA